MICIPRPLEKSAGLSGIWQAGLLWGMLLTFCPQIGQAFPYSAAVLSDQPEGYWRLGEARFKGVAAQQIVEDFSGGARDGAYRQRVFDFPGAPTGEPDSAKFFSIDEPGQISFGSNAALNGRTNNFTVEFWVMPAGTEGNRFLLGNGDPANQASGGFGIFQNGGNLSFRKFGVSNLRTAREQPFFQSPSWHHVAVVMGADNSLSFYRNGELWEAFDPGAPLTPVSAGLNRELTVGLRDGLTSFHGALDELAIYPRALTTQQIQKHYTSARPGDINHDLDVDLSDFIELRDHFSNSPASLSEGDVDLDNDVDLNDFRIFKENFGSLAEPVAVAVPEPAAIWLFLLGGSACQIGWAWARRKRHAPVQ